MAGKSDLPPDVITLLKKEISELKAFVEQLRNRRKPAKPETDRPLPEPQEPPDP
jgi:hypothetical protein